MSIAEPQGQCICSSSLVLLRSVPFDRQMKQIGKMDGTNVSRSLVQQYQPLQQHYNFELAFVWHRHERDACFDDVPHPEGHRTDLLHPITSG